MCRPIGEHHLKELVTHMRALSQLARDVAVDVVWEMTRHADTPICEREPYYREMCEDATNVLKDGIEELLDFFKAQKECLNRHAMDEAIEDGRKNATKGNGQKGGSK